MCLTYASGGCICVVVSFVSVESCRSVGCFSRKLPVLLFFGERYAGMQAGFGAGFLEWAFALLIYFKLTGKKEKNITHFEVNATTIACPRAHKYK